MTDTNIIVSIEERDLVSVFMYGMKGIFPSIVTWNDLIPVCIKLKIDYIPTDINVVYNEVLKQIKSVDTHN